MGRVADEMSPKRNHRAREILAEDNSDIVLVTTLADLFDVKKAVSRDHSAPRLTADALQLCTNNLDSITSRLQALTNIEKYPSDLDSGQASRQMKLVRQSLDIIENAQQ